MSYSFEMYPMMKNVVRPKQFDEREKKRGEIILEYAQRVYRIEFSEKFQKELTSGSKEIPSKRVIDALVREWEFWKPYVSKESYSAFIEDGLNSLIKIKATATFYSESLNGYIGNKATVIKPLPIGVATSVSWDGVYFENGYQV